MINNGKIQQGGRLAVHKADFNSHYTGQGFRHQASNIDLNPVISGIDSTNVQVALESLKNLIVSGGSGFVSIGNVDGYASGSYNVNSTDTPTFVSAFSAAQNDDRLANGGIILILAGSYNITSSVTVKPGITVIGEVGGTYLNSETVEQSMFIVQATTKDIKIGGDSGSGDIEISPASNVDKVKFNNLIFFDNLNETSLASPTMSTVPMISLQQGANLECENVSFFGKLNDGSITNRSKTKNAIGTISGVSQASSLIIKNCFFDGIKTPILFNNQAGSLDYLSVIGCKARVFGKEDASISPDDDCFIMASLCSAEICHNNVTAGNSKVKILVNFGTTGGSTSDIRVVISNNHGNVTTSSPLLVYNNSGVTFNSVISNNNWGTGVNNPWFIIVGGADGGSPAGDIFGPNAINTIMTWGNSLELETTVIVNPGTYTVTVSSTSTSNVCNLKFIGNKRGRNYPVFQLNINSSSVDNIGNKFIVLGNHLESIYFTSSGSFQSVRAGFDPTGVSSQLSAHLMTVRDCIFYNTSLNILNTATASDQFGNLTNTEILVENCSFNQSGAFNDNISLVCPVANLVNIKNCYFTGYGYHFNIGTEAYTSSPTLISNYFLDKIIIDKTSFTIDDSSPGSGTSDRCCVISDTQGKISLNNCTILANNTYASASTVNNSLLIAATPFDSFIYLNGKDVQVSNSVLNGPNQNYQVSAVNYALPCLKVVFSQRAVLDSNKIHSGGLPVQLSASFLYNTVATGVDVINCDIQGLADSSGVCLTMLDIDMEPSTSGVNPVPININGNHFIARNGAAGTQVKHDWVTGATYNVHAIVQIYGRGMDCSFLHNNIIGALYAPTVNPYTHLSGVVVNTFDSDAGSITWITSSQISNNNIRIDGNTYTTASSSDTASAIFVRSTLANVTNNNITFYNNSVVSSSFSGCLALDIRAVGSAGDCNVIGNYFGATQRTGTFAALSRGYITILSSTTVRGKIVNNSFSTKTIDGVSNVGLIEDNTSTANKWLTAYNKNQTNRFDAYGSYGKCSLGSGINAPVEAGIVTGGTTSAMAPAYNSSSSVKLLYRDTGTLITSVWTIPLCQIIPEGAYVTGISMVVDVSANPTTTSNVYLYYRDNTSSTSDSNLALTTSGDTLTLSFTDNERPVTSALSPTIDVQCEISSSTNIDVTLSQVQITYCW